MIYGFDKAINSLEKKNLFEELVKSIKKTELSKIIIIDDASKLKTYAYESWYSSTFGNSDGIWVGKGIGEQNVFKIGMLKREFMVDLKNDYGMYISEGSPTIIKLIEFYKKEGEQDGK
jgi:hypothetical protein